MRLYTLALITLFATIDPIQSQQIGIFEEVTAGNNFGIGAKQMAMGGTGIAHGWDGAALFYNPASITRIYRVEFQLGLTHQQFKSTTSQSPDRYTGFTSIQNGLKDDVSNTRLAGLNLTIPVPTYRGSLAVGFGINRLVSFDRTWRLKAVDRNLSGEEVTTSQDENESGGLYLYTAGAGIDLSPKMSIGLAINIYSGDRKLNYQYNYSDSSTHYSDGIIGRITEDYIGAGLKAGMLIRPNRNLSLGMVFESPVDMQVEQTSSVESYVDSTGFHSIDTYDGRVEYDLVRPLILGIGAAYRIGTLTITTDAEYVDWGEMEYGDNSDMERKNDSLPKFYRQVVNLRFGTEYQFPKFGIALRAGLFSTPLANDKAADGEGNPVDIIDSDKFGFSLGVGWLLDRTFMAEAAYVNGSFENHFTGYNFLRVNREDRFQRLYLTISYRY